MESIPLNDRDVIAAQIGRRPRGVVGVPVRCSYGYPQVIRVRPIVEGAPFTPKALVAARSRKEYAAIASFGAVHALEGFLTCAWSKPRSCFSSRKFTSISHLLT